MISSFLKKHILTKFIVALAPVLFVLILYRGSGILFKNQYDDTYITYRYAANFALGNGLVFNAGERTNAASSLMFTLILSAFYKIGLTNLELISVLINILSASGISLLVYKSILILTKNPYLAFFLALITPLHGFISGWTISGMETVFFTFLVTFFIYQYFFLKKSNHLLITFNMALLLLTRMEAVVILFVWFLSEFYKSFFLKNSGKKSFILQAGIFLMVLLGFYFFQYLYYGSFLSNAVAFKKIATYYQPHPMQLILVWIGTSLIITMLAIFSFFLPKIKKLWFLYLYIILSIITFVTGPHSDGARYSVHVFPIAVILSSSTIKYLSARRWVIILLLLIFSQTIISSIVVRSYFVERKQEAMCRKEIGNYIDHHLSSSDFVLSGDLGMIAYQALNVRFIDLGGLTSKDILISYQQKMGIDRIIFDKKPKILADSFLENKSGELIHPLLMNQSKHIVGMSTYSNLFSPNILRNVLYKCSDKKAVYAVVDLKSLYKQ